jgi:hypothetical protein
VLPLIDKMVMSAALDFSSEEKDFIKNYVRTLQEHEL